MVAAMPSFEFDPDALDRLPPDRRRRAIRQLAKLSGAVKDNPLWGFDPLNPRGSGRPHLKQHRWLLATSATLRVLIGGNRSGKTTAGVLATIIDCCDADVVPPHLRRYKRWDPALTAGGVKARIVGVNGRQLESVTLEKLREWCPKSQLVGNRFKSAFSTEYGILHFKNGSTIELMTQQMEKDAFSGAALHRVHFDEEPLHDHGRRIFAECAQRLIDHNGDMLLTLTPLDGMTWVHDELVLPWERENGEDAEEGWFYDEDSRLYLSKVAMRENPVLDEAAANRALGLAETEEEREAREFGRFVSFQGRTIPEFSKAEHIRPVGDLPDLATAKRVVVGIDPGWRHLAAAVWVAQWPDGQVWVVSAVAGQGWVLDDLAKAILQENARLGVRPSWYVIDSQANQVNGQTAKSDRDELTRYGIHAMNANKAWKPSVDRIRYLLRSGRLALTENAARLGDELVKYRWRGSRRSEDDGPEKPVKKDDHCIDALRYALMSMPETEPPLPPDTRSLSERLLDEDLQQLKRQRRRQTPGGWM
jgi:phage terminase large subunit-like protein